MKIFYLSLLFAFALAFDLTKEPAGTRSTLCSNQRATCSEICEKKVTKNTCSSQSMLWECVCADGSVPTDKQVTFPVVFAQCQGSLRECNERCSKQAAGDQSCIDSCSAQWKCGNLDASVMKNTTSPSDSSPVNTKKGNFDDEGENSSSINSVSFVFCGLMAVLSVAMTAP
jgi:hypothetical protein